MRKEAFRPTLNQVNQKSFEAQLRGENANPEDTYQVIHNERGYEIRTGERVVGQTETVEQALELYRKDLQHTLTADLFQMKVGEYVAFQIDAEHGDEIYVERHAEAFTIRENDIRSSIVSEGTGSDIAQELIQDHPTLSRLPKLDWHEPDREMTLDDFMQEVMNVQEVVFHEKLAGDLIIDYREKQTDGVHSELEFRLESYDRVLHVDVERNPTLEPQRIKVNGKAAALRGATQESMRGKEVGNVATAKSGRQIERPQTHRTLSAKHLSDLKSHGIKVAAIELPDGHINAIFSLKEREAQRLLREKPKAPERSGMVRTR